MRCNTEAQAMPSSYHVWFVCPRMHKKARSMDRARILLCVCPSSRRARYHLRLRALREAALRHAYRVMISRLLWLRVATGWTVRHVARKKNMPLAGSKCAGMWATTVRAERSQPGLGAAVQEDPFPSAVAFGRATRQGHPHLLIIFFLD